MLSLLTAFYLFIYLFIYLFEIKAKGQYWPVATDMLTNHSTMFNNYEQSLNRPI